MGPIADYIESPELRPDLSHLLSRGDYQAYSKTLEQTGLNWLFDFQFPLLACHTKPLEALEGSLSASPRLHLIICAAEPDAAHADCDIYGLYRRFQSAGDTEAAFASLGLAMLGIWESGRDFKRLVPMIREAEKVLAIAEASALAKAFLLLMAGWAEIIGPGDIKKVYGWLDRLYEYAEEAASPSLILLHSVLAAHICFWRGELAAMEIIMDDAGPFVTDPAASPLAKLQFLSTSGLLKTLQGLPDVALVMQKPLMSDPCMDLVPLSSWLFMYGNYLYTAASAGDREEIDRVAGIMRAKSIPARNHYNHSYLHFNLAAAELALGRPYKALLHGIECRKRGQQCSSANVARMSALVIGQALADLERNEEALAHFDEWLPIWEEAGYYFIASLGFAEAANLLVRIGETGQARARFRRARELIPKKERIPSLYRPSGFIHDLEVRLGPDTDSVACRKNRPIEIRVLGDFSVKVRGSVIKKADWHGRQPQRLLKAIIALDQGGRGVPIEQIASMMWPDSDGDLAANAFKVTLYRLRSIISSGDEALKNWIFVRHKRVHLSKELCSVDLFHFEELMRNPALEDDHIEGLETVIAAYTGNFAGTSQELPCIIRKRDQLRSAYVKMVERVHEIRSSRGEHEGAIAVLNRALAFDPLNESLYLRLMESYHASGNRAKALEVYGAACQVLEESLGTGPSESLRLKAEEMKAGTGEDQGSSR